VDLVHIEPHGPGIGRRKRGKGFSYFDRETGEAITDPAHLERISAIVIPPAWQDVWICPDPRGHIQAVGTDAAGRRQYRYHDVWREEQDRLKFARVRRMAERLPIFRERVADHLGRRGLTRERVLAAAARMLDIGFFRVGGESYESFGLATLRMEHVTCSAGRVVCAYPAKGGKSRELEILDKGVCKVITALHDAGGEGELLRYRNGSGWTDVRSDDINAYLKAETGGEFSAKDFRTWSATVLAAIGLAVSDPVATSRTARKRAMTRVVKEVAEYLGNTPAVARSSYIDPRLFDRYASRLTIAPVLDELGDVDVVGEPAFQGRVEAAVLELIEDRQGGSLAHAIA
jgi:DNA topoisomerase I